MYIVLTCVKGKGSGVRGSGRGNSVTMDSLILLLKTFSGFYKSYC